MWRFSFKMSLSCTSRGNTPRWYFGPLEDNQWEGCRKNSKSYSDDWHLWRFWSAFRHFGTHFAESFRMSKSSWMMDPDPTRSREITSCSPIDLAEIHRSSKISSRSLISGVVAVLGRPGRGASQVEKSRLTGPPRFGRWLTMARVSLMFLLEFREFPSAPCLAGKRTWWQLASPDMLPFSLCNKKRLAIRHTNRTLFPTTLSIPSYDIGK